MQSARKPVIDGIAQMHMLNRLRLEKAAELAGIGMRLGNLDGVDRPSATTPVECVLLHRGAVVGQLATMEVELAKKQMLFDQQQRSAARYGWRLGE